MVERDYYPLDIAADKMGISVDDLLHLAGKGELPLILLTKDIRGVLFDSEYNLVPLGVQISIEHEYCFVPKGIIEEYFYEKNCANTSIFYPEILITPNNQILVIAPADNYIKPRIQINIKSLFVLSSNIKAWQVINKTTTNQHPEAVRDDGEINRIAGMEQTQDHNPWLVENPNDPSPVQPWYTPARYFARELVAEDSSLLTKRSLLAGKVVKSLTKAGIYKRGGKKPLDPVTIKKALSNISLG